jgi:hypothetical protein
MIAEIKDWTEAGKNLFSLLRDLFLFLFLVLLFQYPERLKESLSDAGIGEVDVFGFHVKSQLEEAKQISLAAAADIEGTLGRNNEIRAQLDSVITANPAAAPQLAPLRAKLDKSAIALTAASDHLATSIAAQQTALQSANADSPQLAGWMYLGTIDAARSAWKGRDQTTDLAWPVQSGAVGTVDDDAYVRADGAGAAHSGGAFLGVAKQGAKVRVDTVDVAPALPNGLLPVWAKVTVQ